MPKEGSNAWYRAYADRFYLDKANRDIYLYRQAATRLGLVGGLYMGGTIDMNQSLVIDLPTPSADNDAARKKYVDDLVALYLLLAGGTMSGDIAMGGNLVTGLGAPSADNDVARKVYVDDAIDTDIATHAALLTAIHGITKVVKSADQTVTNSTTLENDTELLFAMVANGKYLVLLFLLGNSGTTPDIKVAWSVPSGASGFHDRLNYATQLSSVSGLTTTVNTDGRGQAALTAFYAHIVNGATAGNAVMQFAQAVQNDSDTKVLANSYLIAIRMA